MTERNEPSGERIAYAVGAGAVAGLVYAALEASIVSLVPSFTDRDGAMERAFTVWLFALYPAIGAGLGIAVGVGARGVGPVGTRVLLHAVVMCVIVAHGAWRGAWSVTDAATATAVLVAAIGVARVVSPRLGTILVRAVASPWTAVGAALGWAWLTATRGAEAGAVTRLAIGGLPLAVVVAGAIVVAVTGPTLRRAVSWIAIAGIAGAVFLVAARKPGQAVDDVAPWPEHPVAWTLRPLVSWSRPLVTETLLRRVTRIGLVRRDFESLRTGPAQKRPSWLDADGRAAVIAAPGAGFYYHAEIPPDACLSFAVNIQSNTVVKSTARTRWTDPPKERAIGCVVRIRDGADVKTVYEQRFRPLHAGWIEQRVDLAAWAGRTVKVEFTTAPENLGDDIDENLLVHFADIAVRTTKRQPDRPNIFVLLLDTLRADHLGCYGYERPTSPYMDQLAGEGARFAKTLAAAPWTDPSILALHTGLYPADVWTPAPHAGAIRQKIPSGVDTLAEVLAASGYFTVAVSDHPGIIGTRFMDGFDLFHHLYISTKSGGFQKSPIDDSLREIERLLARRGPSGLFCYVQMLYPHMPFNAPPPFRERFGRRHDGVLKWPLRMKLRKNKDAVINMYDAEILRTDAFVQRFHAMLHRLGLAEDSILVITSDHGEAFWEHEKFEHGNTLYNELLHVPLIVHAPGRVPNVVVDQVASHVDIYPTILDLVGLRPPAPVRGVSLAPAMRGATIPPRYVYSGFAARHDYYEGCAIQNDAEKLIVNEMTNETEYFDLRDDPCEERARPDHPRIAPLRERVERFRDEADARRKTWKALAHEPSADMLKRLRSLGYLK